MPASTADIAKWMIAHGYVTGHGDTVEQLLAELVAGVREQCANSHYAMKGALEEVMEWISGWDPTFIHDEEWPATRDRALAALRLSKEI